MSAMDKVLTLQILWLLFGCMFIFMDKKEVGRFAHGASIFFTGLYLLMDFLSH